MNGINWAFLVTQIVNVLLLVGWVVLDVLAFVRIRRRQMDHATMLWVLAVALAPVVGALAFLILEQDGAVRSSGAER